MVRVLPRGAIRTLAEELRPLGPRLLVLAGVELFGLDSGYRGHKDVVGAATYAVLATDAIDTRDFTDGRYRLLQAQMSGGIYGHLDLGDAFMINEIDGECR